MIELVGKIGSMALINKQDNDIDYNIIARLSRELKPGWVWVSSGATEIGRLDYLHRTGKELTGGGEEDKADYAAQGQTVLMQNYRRFIAPNYSVRQLLVEHQHFNDEQKRAHLRAFLLRCAEQNAVPIVNYNDPVSFEENRKLEVRALQTAKSKVVECVDNDETAAQIACLVGAKYLVILTSADGIYYDAADPSTLVSEITGTNGMETLAAIERYKERCNGTSRKGSGGARAKLEYIKDAVLAGTVVKIASSKCSIADILGGKCRCTTVGIVK